MHRNFFLALIALIFLSAAPGEKPLKIALLKYNGGGDWYANPTSLPNLIKFCNKNLGMNIHEEPATVEVGSQQLFNFPFVHMTGHGNVVFNQQEAENLRTYLLGGGFLHVDDNYGMDKYIRPQLEKLFPGVKLVELPFSHPIFHQKYDFPNGLPKIHEHDNKPPQAFGLIVEGRLVVLYTYETDLGDGWEDINVHKDTPEAHEKALRMGANIISYVFSN
ncbi:MAG: DUF4159 domain-containing protein [Chitinophagales bacterium]|nr:DUF4159 domain-containing protein [Chitinophagales bacterium]MDW8419131.1 DUF4159 domain-containing protein [Chitinophagales bacterium]